MHVPDGTMGDTTTTKRTELIRIHLAKCGKAPANIAYFYRLSHFFPSSFICESMGWLGLYARMVVCVCVYLPYASRFASQKSSASHLPCTEAYQEPVSFRCCNSNAFFQSTAIEWGRNGGWLDSLLAGCDYIIRYCSNVNDYDYYYYLI